MTEHSLRLPVSSDPRPDPVVLRARAVHRAAAELRRGAPVVLRGAADLVLLAAETVGAPGLADLAALAFAPPELLLAPTRAAAVLRRPVTQGVSAVALPLNPRLLSPTALRGLADPTADQLLPEFAASPGEPPEDAGAALALAKIARLLPALIFSPARPDAEEIAGRLSVLSVGSEDVLAHPAAQSAGLVRAAEAAVPLEDAPDARVIAFRAPDSAIEHIAIAIGDLAAAAATKPVLARVHSECFTGDLLGSMRCDCGPQLRAAIRRMAEEGAGVVLYLAQEGRGIGLVNKLRAYAMQDRGLDTLDANRALGWGADERNFLTAATMLDALGISSVRLLTNNPDKVSALSACGIEVAGRESLRIDPNGINDGYLATKALRFGHYLG